MSFCVLKSEIESLGVGRGSLEHSFVHDPLTDSAQTTGAELVLHGRVNYKLKDLGINLELLAVHFEQLLILTDKSVSGLREDSQKRIPVELIKIRDERKTTYNLRDETERPEVLCLDVLEKIIFVNLLFLHGAEADHLRVETLGDVAFDTLESTAADKENVLRIDMDELLLRMLAATLRGNIHDTALKKLEESLLHALT